MDPNTINMIIGLISGLIGGHAAGAAMPDKSLGTVGNSVTGVIGGGLGDWALKALGFLATAATTATAAHTTPEAVAPAAGLDIASLITNIAGSGVSGAALTAIVALIKNAVQKS